ncbi:MAG: hypothetical protein JNK82_04325 [Myxococcaceae bacterium]|nr:hypothetical protein [Myxococcaceae bacterium]
MAPRLSGAQREEPGAAPRRPSRRAPEVSPKGREATPKPLTGLELGSNFEQTTERALVPICEHDALERETRAVMLAVEPTGGSTNARSSISTAARGARRTGAQCLRDTSELLGQRHVRFEVFFARGGALAVDMVSEHVLITQGLEWARPRDALRSVLVFQRASA